MDARMIEIHLYSKLPAPAQGTPIEKILKFKSKRVSELAALRASMDDLYQAIVNSSESAAALTSAVEKLEAAISNAFRAMNEDIVTRAISRLRINLPLGSAIGAVLGHAVGGWQGAALGALAGSVRFEIKDGGVPKGSIFGAPFAYIPGVIKELL